MPDDRRRAGMPTARALDLPAPAVAAVVGCGGKTALIERVAAAGHNGRTLISPTTKMYPLAVDGADCLGRLNAGSGKMEALPEDELRALLPRYALTLLEADGSAGLPCKGWRDCEPAVPRFCTHTVGVVTTLALNRPATRERVHRLPEFLALTGLREGDNISLEALTAMICAPAGMFKSSVGQRLLLVNQVEDGEAVRRARRLLEHIRARHPNRFTKLLYGSVYLDSWTDMT